MIDQGANRGALNAARSGLRLGVGLAAMGAALAVAPSQAQAQQVVPGVDPECPITLVTGFETAECDDNDDIEDGITSGPADPDFDRLSIPNTDGDALIAPPGYFGVGIVRDNNSIDLDFRNNVEINVFDDPNIAGPAQGIILITSNGFGINTFTEVAITANGNGGPAVGIEANASDGGDISLNTIGSIVATTSGDLAIGVSATTTGDPNATGFALNQNINLADITVVSNGVGERDVVTAGIFSFSNVGEATVQVLNQAPISVTSGPNSFDSDFNGIAAGIVTNSFGVGSTTEILNEGAITANGPQTHGIVGFGFDNSVSIENRAAISTNGVGSFGILAQGGGAIGGVGTTLTVDNEAGGDIVMTAAGGTATGIFGLAQTEEASVSISNEASITGSGDNLRGIGVSSFGAPVGGRYDFLVYNEGEIDLDTALGFGITAFATTEDEAVVDIINVGNIILDDTTSTDSIGISGFLIGTDPNAMSDGASLLNIFNSGNITMGAGTAIFAGADDILVTNQGLLSTSAANSHVIRLEGIDENSVVELTVSEDVTATGSDSDAVNITNAGTTTVTVDSGAVVSSGTGDAVAIRLLGSTPTAFADLTDAGEPNSFTQTITIDGATVESVAGVGAIKSSDRLRIDTSNGAVIRTGGNNAPVIEAAYSLFVEAADTTISSMGDNSPLLSVLPIMAPNGTIASFDGTNVTLSTSGANSDAIALGSGERTSIGNVDIEGTDADNLSTVTTTGDGSNAVSFISGGDSTSTFNTNFAEFSTEGDNSHVLEVNNFDGSSTSVSGTNFTASTAGDNSEVFQISIGENSDFLIFFEDAALTSAGGNSTIINVEGRAPNQNLNTVILESTLSTSGDGSAAFNIAAGDGSGSNSNHLFGGTNLATTGDDSDGIHFGGIENPSSMVGGTFTLTFIESAVSTAGANSDGIDVGPFAGASTADLTITDSDLSTMGSNSAAANIAIQDGDGFALSAVVGGSSFTTEGDDASALAISGTGAIASSIVNIGLADSTFSTQGDGSIGVDLSAVPILGQGAVLTVGIDGISATTTGANAHALVLGDLSEFVASDGSNTALVLDLSGVIETTGMGSDGVVIGANWSTPGAASDDQANSISKGFFDIDLGGSISATGSGSVGIRMASLLEVLDITDTGSITADTFAIFSEGAGGIGTLNNAGAIMGDLRFGDEDSTLNNSGTITGNIDLGGGTNAILIDVAGRLNSLDDILLGNGNAITVAGTIAPGDEGPIRVTTIASDLVFETGSQFLVDIDGMAADPVLAGIFLSDRLEVNGSATINGGTVVVSSLTPEGDFDLEAQFRIIGASGGVTGEFDTLDFDLPFLDLELVYQADAVLLSAMRQGPVVPFQTLGTTANQVAVGAAFDALEMDAMGDLDVVVDQLIFASTPQALTAFDSTSGEIYATLLGQSGVDGVTRSREMLARARRAAPQGWGIWGAVSAADGTIESDGNAAEAERSEFGFDFGIDYAGANNSWAAGVAGGYRDGDLEVAGRASEAEYDGWYFGGYARIGSGGQGFTLNSALTFSQNDASVVRSITVNALTRTAVGSAETETFSAAGEVRYGFGSGGNWAFGPVASLTHVSAELSDVSETGAQSLNLSTTGSDDDRTGFGIGAFANWQDGASGFDLSAQYVDGGTSAASTRLAFEGGANAPFTVLAAEADSSGVLASASGQADLGSGWTIGAQVDGFFGDGFQDVSGSAVVGWRF